MTGQICFAGAGRCKSDLMGAPDRAGEGGTEEGTVRTGELGGGTF